MADTIRVQIRWPKPLMVALHGLAANRHTTVAELVRQAVIREYSLTSHDVNPANNGTKSDKGGSLS